MSSGPITLWQTDGEKRKQCQTSFSSAPKCGQGLQTRNQKTLAPWKNNYDKPRQCLKKLRHHFADKRPSSQS